MYTEIELYNVYMATLSNVIGGHGVADGVILLVVQTWRKREKERESSKTSDNGDVAQLVSFPITRIPHPFDCRPYKSL